jgi:hypothetical protein
LRGVVKTPIGQPNLVLSIPRLLLISTAVLQEKRLNALSRLPDVKRGDLSRADEIAHGSMNLVRDPDGFHFARPQDFGEHQASSQRLTAGSMAWGTTNLSSAAGPSPLRDKGTGRTPPGQRNYRSDCPGKT